MTPFQLAAIPDALDWKNDPLDWSSDSGRELVITAGPATDWFVDPAGTYDKDNAPAALFSPPGGDFLLSAKVSVDFKSTFDAGVLQLRAADDLWGKLCFEYSPQGQPMVVSVVTRRVSDDCNSSVIEGNVVHLRLSRSGKTFSFHYSTDGLIWQFVRYFSLGDPGSLQVGFSAQSPTGERCTVRFSDLAFRVGTLKDNRSGE